MTRYSPFRHLDSIIFKRPIQLTVFLTKRCNARCSFCFYHAPEHAGDGASDLTLAELKQVADSLGNLLWLAFSGGEIFLRQDLIEITSYFYQVNKPALILLPSNGLLPEQIRKTVEDILQNCPKSTIVVKLSLDGPEELHDSIRGRNGCFRQTMATYRALSPLLDRYENFDLGINTVFCSQNQNYVLEVIDFVRTLEGIRTHTVSLIRGDITDKSMARVDMQKYREAILVLEKNLKSGAAPIYRFGGSRLKAAQDILQRRLINNTAEKGRRQLSCYAGRLNLVLTENGDLYPCESFSRKLGNVRRDGYDLARLLSSEQARNMVEDIKKDGCFCTHECYMMTNILFNPRQYPALLKEYLQL